MAKLTFSKTPQRSKTDVARIRFWYAKGHKYRIRHSHILYGEGVLPDTYYAQRFDEAARLWEIIGKHRTRPAAERTCQKHHDAAERGRSKR